MSENIICLNNLDDFKEYTVDDKRPEKIFYLEHIVGINKVATVFLDDHVYINHSSNPTSSTDFSDPSNPKYIITRDLQAGEEITEDFL